MMFAAYNAWANQRVYEAASGLKKEEFARDVGAFFKSMRGTLNHILVADKIWLKRFTGEGDAPAALDTILHNGKVWTGDTARPAATACVASAMSISMPRASAPFSAVR